ncbi:MAG: hypothetical protein COB61_003905 [Thiotrichales bacterium]|nr:hypothetical protein [Thiotrichales bacterium]
MLRQHELAKAKKGTRMSRKLIVILFASFVFYSAQTLALGLGGIELSSGLNQPFDAKIKLVSRSENELEGLRVGLASNADFERIGAVRLPFLNDLSFEIISPDGGKPYIKVSSKQPIREPFVDFILEANWPAGRLLREYTVLLDPPTVTTERAAPVQAPTTNRRSFAEPTPAPVPRSASVSSRQQDEPATGGGIIQPTTTAGVPAAKDLIFGPVGANDTLWNIANSMRPTDDVSVQQMMIALLKENPEAFGDSNINNLKRGSTLSIEDESVITELSHNQAVAETGRQYQNWLAAKEARRAARGQLAKQDLTDAATTDSAADGATTDDVVSESDSAPEGGLRLLADDALEDGTTEGGVTKAEGISGEVGELREELELTTFAAESAREQNAELRDRLTGLEEQIATMQRALQFKDDSLTQLQQKLSETGDADALAAGGSSDSSGGGIETLPLDTEQKVEVVAGMMEPDSVASDDVAALELDPIAEVEPASGEDVAEPSMIDNVVKNVGFIGASIKEKVAGLSENFSLDSITEALKPENILERYRDNPLIFRIVSAIIAVLVILGLIVRRRRVAAKEQFDEYAAPHMSDGNGEDDNEFNVVADHGDSAELLDNVNNYITYQRYEKAEMVLQEAIERSPRNNDLKAKLLEVYYSSKNVPAFVVAADEYYSNFGDDQVLWSQVAKMGAELAPDHHLFNSENVAVAEFDTVEGFDELSELDDVDDSDSDADSDDYADIDLEMEVLTADGDVWDENEDNVAEADKVEAAPLVDSTIEETVEDAEELYKEASKELEDEFDLDLELDMSGDDDVAVAEIVSTEVVADVEEVAKDIASEPEDVLAQVVESIESNDTLSLAEDVSLEDTSALTLESAGDANDNSIEAPSLLERAMDNASTNNDEADFNEKFGSTNVGDSIGEPLATYNADDDDGEGYDPSLFSGVDVVSTKLDLAKAYIDMGDQEGARSILSEVVTEGDDEQKSEAKELIEQL